MKKFLFATSALVTLTSPISAATLMIGYELLYNNPPPPYTSQIAATSNSGSISDIRVVNGTWSVDVNAYVDGFNTISSVSVSNSNTTAEDWLNIFVGRQDIVNPAQHYQDQMTWLGTLPSNFSVWYTTYSNSNNNANLLWLYSAGGPFSVDSAASIVFDATYINGCALCATTDVYVIQSHPVLATPLPGAALLFASGLVGVGLIAKRRRKFAPKALD